MRGAIGHHHNNRQNIVHTQESIGKRRGTRLPEKLRRPEERCLSCKRNHAGTSCFASGLRVLGRQSRGGAYVLPWIRMWGGQSWVRLRKTHRARPCSGNSGGGTEKKRSRGRRPRSWARARALRLRNRCSSHTLLHSTRGGAVGKWGGFWFWFSFVILLVCSVFNSRDRPG